MERLLSTAAQPLALLEHTEPRDQPDTGGGLSYETALKLYCDDPGVIGRLHSQFASRAQLLIVRVQEALAEGQLRRAARDAHSLRGMAMYIGSPPIALAAQALESAAAANDKAGAARQATWLVNEVAALGAQRAEDPGRAGDARADQLINALLRRNIQYAIDRLASAAARGDTEALRAGTLALKQMCLCHGHTFDLLAAAAYQLQQAVATGRPNLAVLYVEPVIEAGSKMVQLLLLESAEPPMLCSLREVPGGCSFFSHVLSLPPEANTPSPDSGGGLAAENARQAATSAAASTNHGGGPPVLPRAAAMFSGDHVVHAHIAAAFAQLLPTWLRSVEGAMNSLNFVLLKGEAWILASTARLVGAQRLCVLAGELLRAIEGAKGTAALRRVLLAIKDEARLVLCFLAQERPRQMIFLPGETSNSAMINAHETSPAPATAPAPSALPTAAPRTASTVSMPREPPPPPTPPSAARSARAVTTAAQPPAVASPLTPSLAPGPTSGTPGSRSAVAGVPFKAVRYLTDTALELAGDVAAKEALVGEEMAITAETLTAAAEMVDGLLSKAHRRMSRT